MHKFGIPQRSSSQRDHMPGVLVVSREFWRFCSILFEPKLTLSYRDENVNVTWESTSHILTHQHDYERIILALTSCSLSRVFTHLRSPCLPVLSVVPVFYNRLTKRIARVSLVYSNGIRIRNSVVARNMNLRQKLCLDHRFVVFELQPLIKTSMFCYQNDKGCWNGAKYRSQ